MAYYSSPGREPPVQITYPCSQCGKQFPTRMIKDFDATRPDVCPLCGLVLLNQIDGKPLDAPYESEGGRRQYAEAVEYLKRSGQGEDKSDGK